MHEGSEGSRSPNDRRQKENSGGEAGRSRSTSRVDYERPPLENLEPRNPDDGAGFKPEARLGKGDALRNAVSEQGMGDKPNVEAERRVDGGPASSGSDEAGAPHSSSMRNWKWPSSFEEQSAPESRKVNGDNLAPELKAIGRGDKTIERGDKTIERGDKTIESASMKKAEEMVKKWQTENRPRASAVTPRMVFEYFPEVELATQLDKEFQQLAMALSNLEKQVRHTHDKTRRDTEALTRNTTSTLNEYNILKESFPKNPEEVIARATNINEETLEKADAMVNKWRADGQPYADQVDKIMVMLSFPAIQEATAWEKVSKDVSSAKERLQEAQEKFPKTPEEVWQKNRIEEQRMERAKQLFKNAMR